MTETTKTWTKLPKEDQALYDTSIDNMARFILRYVDPEKHLETVDYIISKLVNVVLWKTIELPEYDLTQEPVATSFDEDGVFKWDNMRTARRSVYYSVSGDHVEGRIEYRDTETNRLVDQFQASGKTYGEVETIVYAEYPKEITYNHANTFHNTFRVSTLRHFF